MKGPERDLKVKLKQFEAVVKARRGVMTRPKEAKEPKAAGP